MDDEVNFDAPAPPAEKSKKKQTRKKRAPARKAPQQADKTGPRFPGLTRAKCADACSAKGCVISGDAVCAHPVKGGLQAGRSHDQNALKRLQEAREQLAVKVDPDRFT